MESKCERYRYNRTLKILIVLLLVSISSCGTVKRGVFKGDHKYFYVSEYSNVILHKDGTFEYNMNMIGTTTGYFTQCKDTIYMTSKYQNKHIVPDSVIFEKREGYSMDSIFVLAHLSGKTYRPFVFIHFYTDKCDSRNLYLPFDEYIDNEEYTAIKLTIGEISSDLIACPVESFNYLYITYDYPARPENYLFMERVKFLIKGDTLCRISDVN